MVFFCLVIVLILCVFLIPPIYNKKYAQTNIFHSCHVSWIALDGNSHCLFKISYVWRKNMTILVELVPLFSSFLYFVMCFTFVGSSEKAIDFQTTPKSTRRKEGNNSRSNGAAALTQPGKCHLIRLLFLSASLTPFCSANDSAATQKLQSDIWDRRSRSSGGRCCQFSATGICQTL